MYNHSNLPYRVPTSNFREGRKVQIAFVFCLGILIIAAPFVLGRSYVFYIGVIALAFIITLIWRNKHRAWISMVSITAATPIAIARQQFACNIIFALWYTLFNFGMLFKLPRWIYLPVCMVILGIITSSLNWMSGDVVRSITRQGAYALNFFIGPFFLLPVVYLKMRESDDSVANLRGLLFFLIVPSTALLVSAKVFGTVANAWEASMHSAMLSEGFYQYRLGKVFVNFLRTEVGFILAALICSSTAIAVSQVKRWYKLVATGCLVLNVSLLLATGSFGSGMACFLGLTAIFYTQLRKISASKIIMSLGVIFFAMIVTYALSPESTKQYLEKRFEHRVVKADTDRFVLWGRAVDQLLEHPEGVGRTFSVGDRVKTFIHNDYLTYAVSYGLFGGMAYATLMVGLLLSFLRMRNRVRNDPAALAVYLAGLGVSVALAANGITDHSNENPWYFNVIWSIIWYCYFCSRPINVNSAVGVKSKSEVI